MDSKGCHFGDGSGDGSACGEAIFCFWNGFIEDEEEEVLRFLHGEECEEGCESFLAVIEDTFFSVMCF